MFGIEIKTLLLIAITILLLCICERLYAALRYLELLPRIHRQLMWMMRIDNEQFFKAQQDNENGYYDNSLIIEHLAEANESRYGKRPEATFLAYCDTVRLLMRQDGKSNEEIESELAKLSNDMKKKYDVLNR